MIRLFSHSITVRFLAISITLVAAIVVVTGGRTGAPAVAAAPVTGFFYTVTGTADNTDAVIHGGTGTAADPYQMSSLRGAVLNANTVSTSASGPITISVPAGTYQLSVNNPNTPGTTGTISFPDLEVGSSFNRNTTIAGTGGMPTIQQTVSGNDVITTGFAADGFTPVAVTLTLQNLAITGGSFSGIFTGVDNGSERSSTTLINCNVHDNSDPFGQGGGIFNQTGDLTVQGCTFSNNTASQQGGAIFFSLPNSNGSPGTFGSLVVTDSTFTNNTANATNNVAGGAIAIFAPNRVENTYSITGSTFTNNHANGTGSKGGGIGSGGQGTLSVTLSRFVGNTATGGGTGAAGQGTSPINAINNWWGCDAAAGSSGCDSVSGSAVTADPRLDLKITSAPGCTSTTVTADFSKNSNEDSVMPTVLNGLTVNFAVVSGPSGSNVSPPSATISGFMASTTLTATDGGTATVSATLDNGTQTGLAEIDKVAMVATNPTDQTVCEGATATFMATANGNPAPTVQWQVSTDSGNSFNNLSGETNPVLSFTTTASQNGNQYRAVFTNSCGTANTTAATLTVANTSTTDPADVSVCQGATANFSTTAGGIGPFHYAWTLDGAPFNGDSPSISVPTGSLSSGNHTVSVTTTGECGSANQMATLTVGGAPVITLSTTNINMWPPNHAYHTFNVTDFVASASSSCDPNVDVNNVVIEKVSSDEPEDSLLGADGTTLNDIVIAGDCKSVQLRVERDGELNGRVNTITFRVRDSQGNTTTITATVSVPLDQSGAGAVDDGPAAGYTVISSCP